MSTIRTLDDFTAKDILTVFSTYGFQKTSMQDIATAVGVSRQAIYKRYGSKEACFQKAILDYLERMYTEIFSVLKLDEKPTRDTLVEVFDIFIGESIEMIRKAHGTQVIDAVLRGTFNSKEDWRIRMRSHLSAFLMRRGVVRSEQEGMNVSLVLIAASKGLLLEEASIEDFRVDMGQIIDALIFSRS